MEKSELENLAQGLFPGKRGVIIVEDDERFMLFKFGMTNDTPAIGLVEAARSVLRVNTINAFMASEKAETHEDSVK